MIIKKKKLQRVKTFYGHLTVMYRTGRCRPARGMLRRRRLPQPGSGLRRHPSSSRGWRRVRERRRCRRIRTPAREEWGTRVRRSLPRAELHGAGLAQSRCHSGMQKSGLEQVRQSPCTAFPEIITKKRQRPPKRCFSPPHTAIEAPPGLTQKPGVKHQKLLLPKYQKPSLFSAAEGKAHRTREQPPSTAEQQNPIS